MEVSALTISCYVITGKLLEVGGLKPLVVPVHGPHHAGPRLFEHLRRGDRSERKELPSPVNPVSPGILPSPPPAPRRTRSGWPEPRRRRGRSAEIKADSSEEIPRRIKEHRAPFDAPLVHHRAQDRPLGRIALSRDGSRSSPDHLLTADPGFRGVAAGSGVNTCPP